CVARSTRVPRLRSRVRRTGLCLQQLHGQLGLLAGVKLTLRDGYRISALDPKRTTEQSSRWHPGNVAKLEVGFPRPCSFFETDLFLVGGGWLPTAVVTKQVRSERCAPRPRGGRARIAPRDYL